MRLHKDLKKKKEIRHIKEVYDLGPWFHDFSTNFNIKTRYIKIHNWSSYLRFCYQKIKSTLKQIFFIENNEKYASRIFLNQTSKQEFILPLLFTATYELNKKQNKPISMVEFFCADGYYSFWCKKNCNVDNIVGYDFNGHYIKQANLMKKILGIKEITFIKADIHDIPRDRKYDIVLNAGGLYHVPDPEKIIKLTYDICSKYAIIQSVITEVTEDQNYFVTPAPDWKHGCRFTQKWIENQIKSLSWKIIYSARNTLQGNQLNQNSSGSVYYLLEK